MAGAQKPPESRGRLGVMRQQSVAMAPQDGAASAATEQWRRSARGGSGPGLLAFPGRYSPGIESLVVRLAFLDQTETAGGAHAAECHGDGADLRRTAQDLAEAPVHLLGHEPRPKTALLPDCRPRPAPPSWAGSDGDRGPLPSAGETAPGSEGRGPLPRPPLPEGIPGLSAFWSSASNRVLSSRWCSS